LRRHLTILALVAALCAVLASAVPAVALTGGQLDGDAHPNVGLVLVNGVPKCSGVLVSPNVFVTAGHCAGAGRVEVTFDETADAESETVAGTLHIDPQFNFGAKDTHDLAAVVLDQAALPTPARLPLAGALGRASKKAILTTVGYGLHGGELELSYDGARRSGTLALKKLSGTEAIVAPVSAGHCFGDSGGPLLLDGAVVALTSRGSSTCTGTSVTYRLDTPGARGFLARFVALP
jgi:hypothetical protein